MLGSTLSLQAAGPATVPLLVERQANARNDRLSVHCGHCDILLSPRNVVTPFKREPQGQKFPRKIKQPKSRSKVGFGQIEFPQIGQK